jgi:hypothetical protein
MAPDCLITQVTWSDRWEFGDIGTCGNLGKPGTESLEAVVASFIPIAIALFAAYGVLFGVFFVISFAIRREDRRGTVIGRAPSLACQSARHIAGWHRLRWDQSGPRATAL